MILADTSVWVDHFRTGEPALAKALEAGTILSHPFVIGEIALGHIRARERVLDSLRDLPAAIVATDAEVRHLIERAELFGRGIDYVDVHLLAAARLSANALLWTRDRTLRDAAKRLDLAFEER